MKITTLSLFVLASLFAAFGIQGQELSPKLLVAHPVNMTFYYWPQVASQQYPNRPLQMSITHDAKTRQEQYSFFDRRTQQRFRDGEQIKAEMLTAREPGLRRQLQQELHRWHNFLKNSPVILTEADIHPNARAELSGYNALPILSLALTAQGERKFSRFTKAHVGEINGIVAGDAVLSAPNIMEPILDGKAQISGGFTNIHEAQAMAAGLNAAVREHQKP